MASVKRKLRKPDKWKQRDHAARCIACAKPFEAGDDVYQLTAITIHSRCVNLYLKQCKELGLEP